MCFEQLLVQAVSFQCEIRDYVSFLDFLPGTYDFGYLWLKYWIGTCCTDRLLLNFLEGNAVGGNRSYLGKAEIQTLFPGSSGGCAFTLCSANQGQCCFFTGLRFRQASIFFPFSYLPFPMHSSPNVAHGLLHLYRM